MGWTEAADRIIVAMDKVISARTVTYDLARLMENSTEVSCSAFAAALAAAM
jgi:isocitrate dehydrogenase